MEKFKSRYAYRKDWKYIRVWHEKYINCGGRGVAGISKAIKRLKIIGFDCMIRTFPSGFIGHRLINIFCNDIKTKKVIQDELYKHNYIKKKRDKYYWKKIKKYKYVFTKKELEDLKKEIGR